MKNTLLKRLENHFSEYEIDIFDLVKLSGNYKASFRVYIYFDYHYSKFKGRVCSDITVKKNETYIQAIQRTIDRIEYSKSN